MVASLKQMEDGGGGSQTRGEGNSCEPETLKEKSPQELRRQRTVFAFLRSRDALLESSTSGVAGAGVLEALEVAVRGVFALHEVSQVSNHGSCSQIELTRILPWAHQEISGQRYWP